MFLSALAKWLFFRYNLTWLSGLFWLQGYLVWRPFYIVFIRDLSWQKQKTPNN